MERDLLSKTTDTASRKRNSEQVFDFGYSMAEDDTGFGLGIVEEVIEAHGWEITVTDGIEGGARFEFRDVEFEA